jgi:tryptophan-rich hypothetical protein
MASMPKNNSKNFDMNSKWTSAKPLLGWRHFRIVMKRFKTDGEAEFELMAACDKDARIWIDGKELKDKEAFREGWLRDLQTT